jgi:large subunit ribosomal protein L4
VVLVEGEENAVLSFRNIEGVHVLNASDVGVADVIGAARLVASPDALEVLTRVASAPVKEGAK